MYFAGLQLFGSRGQSLMNPNSCNTTKSVYNILKPYIFIVESLLSLLHIVSTVYKQFKYEILIILNIFIFYQDPYHLDFSL